MRDYSARRGCAFRAGYVPSHHDAASFAQAIRAIGEPIHGQRPRRSRWRKLLTLLFESHRTFRYADPPRTGDAAEDDGRRRGRRPKRSIRASTCGRRPNRLVGKWIRDNLGPKRIVAHLARRRSCGAAGCRSAAGDRSPDRAVLGGNHASARTACASIRRPGSDRRAEAAIRLPAVSRYAYRGDARLHRLAARCERSGGASLPARGRSARQPGVATDQSRRKEYGSRLLAAKRRSSRWQQGARARYRRSACWGRRCGRADRPERKTAAKPQRKSARMLPAFRWTWQSLKSSTPSSTGSPLHSDRLIFSC